MDLRLKKWIKWLDIIHEEIRQLVLFKDIFWTVQDLIKNNKNIQKPTSFYDYLGKTYVRFLVVDLGNVISSDR